jgi:uncharacterized protein (TIGR02118 family)
MIKFSVYYPWQENARFDEEYYLQTHIPMVHSLTTEHGLHKLEVVMGKPGFRDEPPRDIAVANLYFTDLKTMQLALKASGKALAEDLQNYTDVAPVQEISEVVGSE